MPNQHLGERAQLYALGALDADEADRVNAHAARCADCARLVGAAERAVTTLAAATVPNVEPPPELERRIAAIGRVAPLRRPGLPPTQRLLRWSALAASMLVVLGGAAAGTRDLLQTRNVVAQDDAALAMVANSHFKHATLTKSDPSAPTSKVLWGTSNRWLYLIVDSSTCACRITVMTDTGERDLGAPLGHGTTAALFAKQLPRLQSVELRRNGRTIESARLR